ncbi:MAG TPA: NAD(P)-binding domain-containing protein [Candidatus Limnocylindrales bacterium]
MSLPSRIENVVIGAGQAGLAMSHLLSRAGRDHVVLERRPTLGGGWQDRWDDFCLVTPNWSASFGGDPYRGSDPDGFMTRDEIVARVASHAATIRAPVVLDTEAVRIAPRATGGFTVDTSGGGTVADRVVVAAGSFHSPRIPQISAALPARLMQIHSHHYRREEALPPGGVLVVGTGQSGVQIAEELAEAGRRVYVSVGTAGRVPRRYRGKDIFHWLGGLAREGPRYGVELPTVDKLPDPRLRLAGNPHLSGHSGGHDTNLREFAARGMTLLGRIENAHGERLDLADDLAANLARADRFFDERFRQQIDTFIERSAPDTVADDRQPFDFDPPVPDHLDLASEDISSVIWTSGYRLDYSWIDAPIVDEMGIPRQKRGVSEVPGLYFLGLIWQHNQVSATLFGPHQDGPYVATQMGVPVTEDETPPVVS